MAELGLFTPDNPVTAYTGPEAIAAATATATTPSADCATYKMVTGDLPPAAAGRGLVRAQVWRDTHPVTYHSQIENAICSLVFFKANPWVDGPQGRTLMVDAGGAYVLLDTACLQGFGADELKAYDLAGHYVCSIFPKVPTPPPPKLPAASPGQDPTQGGLTLPGRSGGPRIGLPLGPLNIGGLNLGELGKLLAGLGGGQDLGAVVAAVAAVVLAVGGVRGALEGISPALGDVFAPGFRDLVRAFDAVSPQLGTVLRDVAGGQGKDADDRLQKVVSTAVVQALTTINPAFGALTGAGLETLQSLPAKSLDFLKDLVRKLLDLYRAELEDKVPIDASNVDTVASGLLIKAMAAGLTAQLAAFGIELLHPFKNLGMSQAVGLVAQFAGFAEIIKPYIGASLRFGLALPAEHRAAAHFRTALPDPEVTRELAAADLVSPEIYRDRLILAGLPDPYPDALLAHLYRPLRPGELARILDGSESDRPWIADRLRYAGYSPGDAAKVTQGIELKTTQPGRQRLVGAALTAYRDGHLERPDLDAALDHAKVSQSHKAYYLEAADLERRSRRITDVAAEILAAYRNDTLTRDKATQVLLGLGMAADEVTAQLVVRDIQRGTAQVGAEEKQLETEIRATKAAGLKLALGQLRAGFLDQVTLVAVGAGMGYAPAFLHVAADLERLKGKPKTTAAAAAIGTGALEEIQGRLGQLVAAQVQLKRVDRVSALVALRGLGLPQSTVEDLLDLAGALAGPTAIAGHYGLRDRGKLGNLWGAVLELLGGGFAQIPAATAVLERILAGIHLPSRERDALTRLIADLRDLFRRS